MSGLYVGFCSALLRAEVNYLTDSIRVACIDDTDYAVNLDAHDYLSQIPTGAVVATSGDLAGKQIVNGWAKAQTLTIPAVTGDIFEALVVYKWTGNAATSRLMAYLDSDLYQTITPNGADCRVFWNTSGIFRI
ncbi:hypothetical protein SEA_YEET_39 [Mycobacterium phage Yeet]|nr:hypothetical protein SEA_EJIMIX_41 [Mycobacterium phage Ejimix]QBI97487.1 hypothetical protein SEA_HUGHESYANG_39 [Mycobacterium phage Hughesyang]QCO93728.1 hypothetical protein SEA_SCHATZIE_38 [Mycobacterium phage Schatzie]QDM57864.1 hypothetical protein SEA_NIHILNOMEN_40 [Mycobacterium phage NihilNomen]QED12192.1 hypothetical protein SEA_YEET_39 [Mycobacterium phage Yeet]QQM15202.1 hypothetical protein SEA_POUND_42 [Mycobacterium phage Pound]WNM72598.1 hypothetical protein SEA_BOMBITAS_37